ncbi:MAG TPA: sigma-54 dependent transcriptional regulator [Pirellulales bacterium]|nr:sigma-54 dependent transcriptional regulator [Pirellulales bacterium]
MPTLLIIDDEASIRFSIAQVFASAELRVLEAATADEGVRLADDAMPDVILLDIRLGQQSGLDVFQQLRQIDPRCLVVFITGHGSADTAIEAMKSGALDYLVKPLDLKQLRGVVEKALALSRLVHVPATFDEAARPETRPDRLIGNGAAMRQVCKLIGRVAPQDVSVLLSGESGTGKELVARAIYHHSRRSDKPFLAINCAAIPETLLESELFGHERGAFTGAERRRIGKFEQCDGGTLLLDEVGDMAPGTQAKMLRLLQAGCFQRLGGSETITSDVRIIAATNQNLEALIAAGRFRLDLFHRLHGVQIHLPPLRERRDDIPELAHYFLFRYAREIGTNVQSISPEALELLERHTWPGNVRELQNVMREAIILTIGPTIGPEALPTLAKARPEAETLAALKDDADWLAMPRMVGNWLAHGEANVYRRSLEQFDRLLLEQALAHTKGNQARAAEILGVSRVTLRAKLRALGLLAPGGEGL